MTDLLTPEEVREIQKRAEGTAQYFDVKVEDMEAHFPTVAEKGRLCRDYLTLWDRNKELEKERDSVCKTAKVRKHLSGTNRTFLDYP